MFSDAICLKLINLCFKDFTFYCTLPLRLIQFV